MTASRAPNGEVNDVWSVCFDDFGDQSMNFFGVISNEHNCENVTFDIVFVTFWRIVKP